MLLQESLAALDGEAGELELELSCLEQGLGGDALLLPTIPAKRSTSTQVSALRLHRKMI